MGQDALARANIIFVNYIKRIHPYGSPANRTAGVSRTKADIQFSGHTHGGQMFPINLITRSIYELSWGYKKRNTHFFVRSGLRLWEPPVRTNGKSEIMLVDIHFK